MTIDIGLPAIDRASNLGGYWTYLSQDEKAYESGTTYKCRDSVFIGDVAAGSKQVFSGLSLSVQPYDLIGCYFAEGTLDYDATGYAGQYEVEGDHAHTNDEATYDDIEGAGASLYGSSEAAPVAVGRSRGYIIG
ncbi:hypothetical protein ES708_09258 [subsurface metagenome]